MREREERMEVNGRRSNANAFWVRVGGCGQERRPTEAVFLVDPLTHTLLELLLVVLGVAAAEQEEVRFQFCTRVCA